METKGTPRILQTVRLNKGGTVGPTTRLVPPAFMILHVKYACPPRRKSQLDAVSPPEPRLPPYFPIL